MIFRFAISAILICSFSQLNAQTDPEPLGSRSGAMANVSVTLSDIWSVHNNQAGLADVEHTEVAVYYKNRFLVEGLDYQAIAFVHPTKSGVFGLSWVSDGNALYRETKLGLSYGRKLTDILDLGVQLNYHGTRIGQAEYGSTSALTGEIGVMADVSEEIRLAAHLFNPSQTTYVENLAERIRTILKFGGQYTFSEKAILIAEVVKDLKEGEALRFGVEYMVVDNVFLRGGVGTEPTLTGFGIGMEVSSLKLDVSANYDSNLGYSPNISLAYQIKGKGE